MNASGWTQLILFSVILLALTKPMGLYLVRVLDANGRTFLDPALKPVERLVYRLAGIDPTKEQDWKGYAISVLIFSLVTLLVTYLILRLQGVLPLNPQGFSGVAGDLRATIRGAINARRCYGGSLAPRGTSEESDCLPDCRGDFRASWGFACISYPEQVVFGV
jgi:hypothetical protein